MSPRTTWVGIVCALLALSFVAYGTLIVVAVTDPSFAVETDYERKARDWDRIARERAASEALGWSLTLETAGAAPGRRSPVVVDLRDREGRPVTGAEVTLELFHNARAADRIEARLAPGQPGRYAAMLPIDRPGLWEFRLRAARGGGLFLKRVRRMIPPVERGAVGAAR